MSKILLVEDDPQYREMLTKRLRAESLEVLSAQSGEEALRILHTESDITLIILDLIMPNMDGFTFFYHLKKTLGDTRPVVILTNLTDTAFPENGDIRDFIVKANTSLTDVIDRIKKQLE